jgi:rhodanese-related sulfurtransferase
MDVPQVSVSEVPDDAVMLDVREQDEWDAGHAPGAVHIPLSDLPSRLGDLPDDTETLAVVCRSGGRSNRAAAWLAQQGFDVANVDGGMRAWQGAGKPLVAAVSPATVK